MTAEASHGSGARVGLTAEPAERTVFGIKAKLLAAFCAMAGLTILAGAVAWYAFGAIGRSVDRITVESVPAMATSLPTAIATAR